MTNNHLLSFIILDIGFVGDDKNKQLTILARCNTQNPRVSRNFKTRHALAYNWEDPLI
jgi:hypothetical protein